MSAIPAPTVQELNITARARIGHLKTNIVHAIEQAFADYYRNPKKPHHMPTTKGLALAPYFNGIIQPADAADRSIWHRLLHRFTPCTFARSVTWIGTDNEEDTLGDLLTRYEQMITACNREAGRPSKFALLVRERVTPLISTEALLPLLCTSEAALNGFRAALEAGHAARGGDGYATDTDAKVSHHRRETWSTPSGLFRLTDISGESDPRTDRGDGRGREDRGSRGTTTVILHGVTLEQASDSGRHGSGPHRSGRHRSDSRGSAHSAPGRGYSTSYFGM